MKRADDSSRAPRCEAGEPVIETEMRVNQVDRFPLREAPDRRSAPIDGPGVLRFRDDSVSESEPADLVLQQTPSDVRESRVDTAASQRADFTECDRGGAGPLVKRCEMQNSQLWPPVAPGRI